MFKFEFSDSFLLFSYFIILMLIGSFLLFLPVSWNGNSSLLYIDALFTSVSAVCVTGLVTVPVENFSTFGFMVIMFLIQFGGLGFITITTLYLIIPRRKLNLIDAKIIKQYSLSNIEYNPISILKSILFTTFVIEFIGFVLLFLFLRLRGIHVSVFESLFTVVSSFCNAGFSMHNDDLFSWKNSPEAILVIALLVSSGGLGFMVYRDIGNTIKHGRKLSLHVKIVLSVGASLIILGAILFYITESPKLHEGYTVGELILNSIFYSISTRTAGFSFFPNDVLTGRTEIISLPFMFIGAAPGSTAGGIKTTTFFLIMLAVFRSSDGDGYIVGKYKISIESVRFALLFFVKAIFILCFSFLMLLLTDGVGKWGVLELAYETFSAFGTVGLSVGVTPHLSFYGKIIIILTMFAGRIGLFSMAIFVPQKTKIKDYTRPQQDILVG